MRKAFTMVALLVTLSTICSCAAKRNFQTGKLLSVTTDERLDEGTSYRSGHLHRASLGFAFYTARGSASGGGPVITSPKERRPWRFMV